jgi:hypothetical protein
MGVGVDEHSRQSSVVGRQQKPLTASGRWLVVKPAWRDFLISNLQSEIGTLVTNQPPLIVFFAASEPPTAIGDRQGPTTV